MAILKNREVQIIGRADATDASPNYTVMHKDGSRENARRSELRFTKDEVEKMKKTAGDDLDQVNVIDDKELNDLRDGQNPQKIQDKQDKVKTEQVTPQPVVQVQPGQSTTVTPVTVQKASK
jgi:hypothetical protein